MKRSTNDVSKRQTYNWKEHSKSDEIEMVPMCLKIKREDKLRRIEIRRLWGETMVELIPVEGIQEFPRLVNEGEEPIDYTDIHGRNR